MYIREVGRVHLHLGQERARVSVLFQQTGQSAGKGIKQKLSEIVDAHMV